MGAANFRLKAKTSGCRSCPPWACSGRDGLDLSRLSEESRNLMRRQLFAPTWKIDAQGRQVVEPKDQT